MTRRKTRVRKHVIADMSLHFLAYKVASCSFTTEPTSADYGYDLSIFTFDAQGQYENGNIFVQLKASDHLRVDPRSGDIIFRIDIRDIATWEGELFPVYLVVFDARYEKAYAVNLQRYFVQNGIAASTMTAKSIDVRLSGVEVDGSTIKAWRKEKNAVLAQLGVVTRV